MKRLLLIILSLSVVLAACNTESSETTKRDTVKITHTYEFKDKNKDHNKGQIKKESINVPKNPERVVVMDYGALDVMKALKLQNRIVAVAKGQGASFLPQSLKEFKNNKYDNLGNPGQPDYNQLAKAKPDVIFASFRQAHTKTLDEMKKAAPDAKIVFVSPNNDDYIDSIKKNTNNIGHIFGKEKEAQKLTTRLDNKVKQTRKVINQDTALFLNVDDKGIKSYGSSGRFGGFLNKDLGIKHADSKMKANSSGILISNEYLEKVNPDKLFVINRTTDSNKQQNDIPQALNNSVIKNVNAIKNEDVTPFEANAWFFGEGGIDLTIKQLDQIKHAYISDK